MGPLGQPYTHGTCSQRGPVHPCLCITPIRRLTFFLSFCQPCLLIVSHQQGTRLSSSLKIPGKEFLACRERGKRKIPTKRPIVWLLGAGRGQSLKGRVNGRRGGRQRQRPVLLVDLRIRTLTAPSVGKMFSCTSSRTAVLVALRVG